MDLKGRRVGETVTFIPALNGNRDLPTDQRIEVDLLPLSNADVELFASNAIEFESIHGNPSLSGIKRDPTKPIRRVLVERVPAVRNLSFLGKPVASGADLEALMDAYRSHEMAELISEIVRAASDLSTLEEGLRKN